LDEIDPEAPVTDEVAHNIIDVLSDTMFNYAVDEAAQMRAKHKHLDTYYHYFTFSGSHTLANLGIEPGSIRRPPLMPLRYLKNNSIMTF
jgi:hypothetical protein